MILLDVTQTFHCNLIVGDVSCITRVSPSSGGCQARVQWSDINTLSSAMCLLAKASELRPGTTKLLNTSITSAHPRACSRRPVSFALALRRKFESNCYQMFFPTTGWWLINLETFLRAIWTKSWLWGKVKQLWWAWWEYEISWYKWLKEDVSIL